MQSLIKRRTLLRSPPELEAHKNGMRARQDELSEGRVSVTVRTMG